MFNSPVLDIAIGLIFIYVLYSLLATTVKETIGSVFSDRGRMLRKGIMTMFTNTAPFSIPEWRLFAIIINSGAYLNEDADNRSNRQRQWIQYRRERWAIFIQRVNLWFTCGNTLYNRFYQHPVIKNYSDGFLFRLPAYISPSNFSRIATEILQTIGSAVDNSDNTNPAITTPAITGSNSMRLIGLALDKKNAATINEKLKFRFDFETQQILMLHYNNAHGDLALFRTNLETWYNDSMERVSGWYKRQVQARLLLIGFCMAVIFNLDSIQIVQTLSENKVARELLAANATTYVQNHKASDFTDPYVTYDPTKQPALPATTTVTAPKSAATDSITAQNLNMANQILGLGWNEYGLNDIHFLKHALLPEIKASGFLAAFNHDCDTALLNNAADTLAIAGAIKAEKQYQDSLKKYYTNPTGITPLVINAASAPLSDYLIEMKKANDQNRNLVYYNYRIISNNNLAALNNRKTQLQLHPQNVALQYAARRYYNNPKTNCYGAFGFKVAYVVYKITGSRQYRTGFWGIVWSLITSVVHWNRIFFGMLISAFAISMGAPFWFDLLGKFVNIRGTGKKLDIPDDSTSSTNGATQTATKVYG